MTDNTITIKLETSDTTYDRFKYLIDDPAFYESPEMHEAYNRYRKHKSQGMSGDTDLL